MSDHGNTSEAAQPPVTELQAQLDVMYTDSEAKWRAAEREGNPTERAYWMGVSFGLRRAWLSAAKS